MLDLLTNLFLFFDTLPALMRIKVLRFYCLFRLASGVRAQWVHVGSTF